MPQATTRRKQLRSKEPRVIMALIAFSATRGLWLDLEHFSLPSGPRHAAFFLARRPFFYSQSASRIILLPGDHSRIIKCIKISSEFDLSSFSVLNCCTSWSSPSWSSHTSPPFIPSSLRTWVLPDLHAENHAATEYY